VAEDGGTCPGTVWPATIVGFVAVVPGAAEGCAGFSVVEACWLAAGAELGVEAGFVAAAGAGLGVEAGFVAAAGAELGVEAGLVASAWAGLGVGFEAAAEVELDAGEGSGVPGIDAEVCEVAAGAGWKK